MTTHPDERGVPRQDHYGEGRQPFDDILDLGWGAVFAAGNIMKYLRRTKAPEHSLESARWYRARLEEMARGKLAPAGYLDAWARVHAEHAGMVLRALDATLTRDEINRLRG